MVNYGSMEKAILKTLIYSDIFDYPLKVYEIHKWLIGKKIAFQSLEKTLITLSEKGKIGNKKNYFFLKGRESLVKAREQKEKQSKNFFLKAEISVLFLKLIPTLKLVGISGGLALNNADSSDDIDLFLITAKNRLWISRILVIFILDLLRVRRKAKMKGKSVAGKICLNILIEDDKLEQINKDIFVAHEVLQMKVLWQRSGVYSKFLSDNAWVFEFLPNWIGPSESEGDRLQNAKHFDKGGKKQKSFLLENLAKKFQLRIMQKPQGLERIENGGLYFHPNDVRPQVLKEYRQRLKTM